jgi:hypothetical protein
MTVEDYEARLRNYENVNIENVAIMHVGKG